MLLFCCPFGLIDWAECCGSTGETPCCARSTLSRPGCSVHGPRSRFTRSSAWTQTVMSGTLSRAPGRSAPCAATTQPMTHCSRFSRTNWWPGSRAARTPSRPSSSRVSTILVSGTSKLHRASRPATPCSWVTGGCPPNPHTSNTVPSMSRVCSTLQGTNPSPSGRSAAPRLQRNSGRDPVQRRADV